MLVRWKNQTRMRVVTTLALRLATTQAARTRVVHRVETPTLTQILTTKAAATTTAAASMKVKQSG